MITPRASDPTASNGVLSSNAVKSLLANNHRVHPVWYNSTLLMSVLTVILFGLAQIDERTLLDISVWTKPFKFALSLAVYFGTLLILARFVPENFFGTVSGRLITFISVSMGFAEMFYIALQASLGEASHFNVTSAYHATMYSLMGLGAFAIVAVLPWFAWFIARHNDIGQPMTLAVVLGLVLTFVLGGGFGGYLGSAGSHFVDVAHSDANGTWLFHWNREGGDLRVAHFFGMHMMQVLPLFTLLLPKRWPRHVNIACVIAFTSAYTALTCVTFLQAVDGQPFL